MPSIDDLPAPDASPSRSSGIDDLPAPPAQPSRDSSGNYTPEVQAARDEYVKNRSFGGKFADIMLGRQMPGDDNLVAGKPPMVIPAGAPVAAAGRLAEYLGDAGKVSSVSMQAPEVLANPLIQLASGKGLGYAAGRTALSAGQGAVMSALDGKEGESWQDKLDRAESGGKLSGGIQLAAESVPYVGKFLGALTRKVTSGLSGIDENLLKNYIERPDAVNKLIKDSGGDVTAAADQVRREISQGVQATKRQLGQQIGSALEAAGPDKTMHVGQVLDALDQVKGRINPTLNPEGHAEIDEMANRIFNLADENGNVSPSQMHEIKEFLAERGKSAYMKGGQIFQAGRDAQQAAKAGAAVARKSVNAAVPEVAQANNQLSAMHTIEDNLNRNLIAEGKPDGALLAAGAGKNARNAKMLGSLGDLAGVDAVGRAKDLATAQEFAKPGLFPKYSTGKSLLGGAAAMGASHFLGPAGYILAPAASPAAIKVGVNVGNAMGKVASAAGIPAATQFIRQNAGAAQAATQLAASQIRRANTDNPMTGGKNQPAFDAPPALMQKDSNANRSPAKGYDAYALDGAQKLGIQDQATAQQLMQDPKARQLLLQAHDYPAGHAKLKQIMSQLQKGMGGK